MLQGPLQALQAITASLSPGAARKEAEEAARKEAAEAARKEAAEAAREAAEAARKAGQRARASRSRASTKEQKAEWLVKFPEQPFVRKAGKRGRKEKDNTGLSKADSDKLEARRARKKVFRQTNNAKERWVAKPGRDFSFAKQAGGYNKSSTITMEADKARIGFYTRALKKAALAVATGVSSHAELNVKRPDWLKQRSKTVLDIGTGDNGLLAGLALKAGAAHVVAVDIRADAAVNAHSNLEKMKVELSSGADVSVYQADIRALDANAVRRIKRSRRDRGTGCSDCEDLVSKLKKVNVIVNEVFGTVASEEGIVQIMTDLRLRLDPTQTVVCVPAQANTLICPALLPPPDRFTGGCVNSHDGRFRAGYATHPEPFQLAPPQAAEVLDLVKPPPLDKPHCRELSFKAERKGQWDALHVYLQLVCGTESMTSGGPQSNWEDVYLNLGTSVSVQPETTIRLKFTALYKEDSNWYCVEVLEPLAGKCRMEFDSAALYALAGRRLERKPAMRGPKRAPSEDSDQATGKGARAPNSAAAEDSEARTAQECRQQRLQQEREAEAARRAAGRT